MKKERRLEWTARAVVLLGLVLSVAASILASAGQIQGGLNVGLSEWKSLLIPATTDVAVAFLLLSWYVQRARRQPAGLLLFLASLTTGYGAWLTYTHAKTDAQGVITAGASVAVFVLLVAKLWHSSRDVPLVASEGVLFTVVRWVVAPKLSGRALVLRVTTSPALRQAQMYRAVYEASIATGAEKDLSKWRANVSVMPEDVRTVALASPRAAPRPTPDATPSGQPSHLPVQPVHALDGTGRLHLAHLPSGPDGQSGRALGRADGRADGRVPSTRALPSAPSPVPKWQTFTPAQVAGFRREFAPQVAKIKAAITDWATREQLVPSMETEIAVYAGVTSRRAQQKIQAVFGADRADVEPVHRAAVS